MIHNHNEAGKLDALWSQAGRVPQKPEDCGQKLWGEGKESVAEAEKEK